jgi:hypothetical protein
MTVNAMTETTPSRSVSGWRLWFPLVAAPAASVIQGGLGWLIGARVCDPLTTTNARGLIAIVSILMLLLAVAATMTAGRTWRMVSPETSWTTIEARSRTEFLAVGGMFISGLLALGIIWGALTALLITRCGSMR